MEVIAKARYIRMAPRKVRLVVDAVRGRRVKDARTQLKFMKKAAAEPVLKLVNSAVANAKHNFHLDEETLVIKKIFADGGPVLYRFTPKAHGRATPIAKRTSHITVVLEGEAVLTKKQEKKDAKASKEIKKDKKEPEVANETQKKTERKKQKVEKAVLKKIAEKPKK